MPKITAVKTVQVEAKTLRTTMKVRDSFSADLLDADGQVLKEYEGYVPRFMPGEHYGDYLYLDIDIDTGQITNWKQVSAVDIEKFIRGNED